MGNFFKWLVYKIKHSNFGRWFANIRASRKAKREAKRLAELAGKQKKKNQTADQSLSEIEGDSEFNMDDLNSRWKGMIQDDSSGQTESPKRKKRIIRKVNKIFKRKKKGTKN